MKLGIRGRLIASFAIVLLLLAGVAGFSLNQLGAGQAAITDLANAQLPAVQIVMDIKVQALTLQRDARQVLLVSGPAATTAKAQFDAAETQLAADFVKLPPLLQLPETRAALAELVKADATWKPLRTGIVTLALSGKTPEALAILSGPANVQALGDVNSAIDTVIQLKLGRVAGVVPPATPPAGKPNRL